MAKQKEVRHRIWLLAHGLRTRSRQPSFAPPTARPVVTTSSFSFGWDRKSQCFMTMRSNGFLNTPSVSSYPCDMKVAEQMLRRCAYEGVRKRFFCNSYSSKDDAEIYAAAGQMFGLVLNKCFDGPGLRVRPAEASLYFYAPGGGLLRVGFHDGMTSSFAKNIAGLKLADIRRKMQWNPT